LLYISFKVAQNGLLFEVLQIQFELQLMQTYSPEKGRGRGQRETKVTVSEGRIVGMEEQEEQMEKERDCSPT